MCGVTAAEFTGPMNATNSLSARPPWTMAADHPDPEPTRSPWRDGQMRSATASPAPTPPDSPTGSAAAHESTAPAAASTPDGTGRRRARLAGITALWWLHAAVRVVLALLLLVYGGSKLVLAQFGVPDLGDALIAHGEMSPMGLLWRMVGYSPLFQFLAGLAEVGAALALLWRRSVILGALLALADMAFVFVLNLGYDVMVKQMSLAMIVMALVVLIPWMKRIALAVMGQGAVAPSPIPRLLPWRTADKVGSILAPIAVGLLSVAVAVGTWSMLQERHVDTSAPAGVWTVTQDAAAPAAQLAEDQRWSAIAFGQVEYDGIYRVQIRRADGHLLEGKYTRVDKTHVRLEMRPLRSPGMNNQEYQDVEPQRIDLTLTQQGDDLHVTGDGIDLVLTPHPDGRLLYDRGFQWMPREDDPFNR